MSCYSLIKSLHWFFITLLQSEYSLLQAWYFQTCQVLGVISPTECRICICNISTWAEEIPKTKITISIPYISGNLVINFCSCHTGVSEIHWQHLKVPFNLNLNSWITVVTSVLWIWPKMGDITLSKLFRKVDAFKTVIIPLLKGFSILLAFRQP